MRCPRGRLRTKSAASATSSARHHPVELRHVGRPPTTVADRELGVHATRAQVRAPDPMGTQLVIERPGEADLGELRAAVHGLVGQAATTGLGRDRDEVPAAARDQMRNRGGGHVHHALDVRVDHLVEMRGRRGRRGGRTTRPRVRDHDVDAAEPVGGRVDERLRPARGRGHRSRRRATARARGRRPTARPDRRSPPARGARARSPRRSPCCRR